MRRLTENEETGKQDSVTFTFPCHRWLAKGEDDGAIVRELVPAKITEEAVNKSGKVSLSDHRVDALEGTILELKALHLLGFHLYC